MTAQTTTKKRPILLIVGGLIGLCVLCIAGLAVMDAMGLLPETTPIPTNLPLPTPTIPPTPSPAQKYFEEYGGRIEVYEEIFSLTDCTVLQERFEIAYDNNQRETPGTPLSKVTLGYMTAIDDHMKTIGCYTN